MTTAAKKAFGVQILVDTAPVAPSAPLTEILSLTPPGATRDTMDVTTHDSVGGAEEFIPEGTYTPGEISGQMHYIAGSVSDTLLTYHLTSGALLNFKIRVKGINGLVERSGSGYLTEYSVDEMPVKGKQAASFTIKVTGAITQADVA